MIGSAGGRVLRWRPGVAAPDDIFGAGNPACTLGLAVSSGGTIIASCSTYAKRVRQGVIDSIGFVNDLWTFVNDRGDYAGFEITSYSPALFHRAEGQPSWAWLFAGRYASPAGLNNRGDVTVNGEWHQGLNDSRAALVTADSSVDLSAKYPWLGRVSGINDDQWIVGTKTGDPADVFLLIDGTAARVRQLISGSESLSNVVSVLALTNSRRMLVRAKDGQYAVLAPPN